MSIQQHMIKRQILELKVPGEKQARRLYAEASRIYRQRIVPIIDQHCSELSAPDRIHRIESLQLDLGYVNPRNLEADLVTQLNKVFPKALAEQIRNLEPEGSRPGQGSKEMSQLELFAFFARTGSLPWWADPARPRLLNDVLQGLIRNTPDPLTRLMRELARESRSLQRIVLHFDDETLSGLCGLLAPCLEAFLNQLPQELVKLLQKNTLAAGRTEARQRNHVWLGMLHTACFKGEQLREPMPFWKEVLLQIALASGMTYSSIVSGMHRALKEDTADVDDHLKGLMETLFKELLGKDSGGEVRLKTPGGLQRPGVPLSAFFATLRAFAPRLPNALRSRLLAALKPREDRLSGKETGKDIIQVLRPALEQNLVPSTVIRQWLADLRNLQASDLSSGVQSELSAMLQATIGNDVTVRPQKDETIDDLRPGDADDLCIENSGLVILWPFLSSFFERLGQLQEKQFKDNTAIQRAVGLLQYISTEDPSPPEYLVPLNKVLCGMALTEVFDFGPPVTKAEAQECTNLLGAVIGHAPILKNMSLSGFRGTFLLRQGVLGTRDGAWLLRVERESYDVVLDRFSWVMDWVKLPWMEVSLRVEW